jgi:FAD/FMN-containing dehydrogenase
LLNAPAARGLPDKGVPRPREGYLLAALGTAPGAGVERQRDELAKVYRAAGAGDVVDLADEASDTFWRHVAERPAPELGPDGIRIKAAVPISQVPAAVRALEEGGAEVGGPPAVGGRAGSGVLYANWPPAEALTGERAIRVGVVLRELRGALAELGGSLIVEECPRALKDHLDVWGEVGSSLALMRRLKAALDPNEIMNPGRFVGGM